MRDDLERRRADLDAELQQRLLEFEQQLRDKMEEDKRSRTIKMEKERNAQREKLKKEAEETKIREARVREANARLLAEKERRDTLQKQRMAEVCSWQTVGATLLIWVWNRNKRRLLMNTILSLRSSKPNSRKRWKISMLTDT